MELWNIGIEVLVKFSRDFEAWSQSLGAPRGKTSFSQFGFLRTRHGTNPPCGRPGALRVTSSSGDFVVGVVDPALPRRRNYCFELGL